MTAKRAGAFLCQIRQKRLTLPGSPNRESGRSGAQQGSIDALAAVRNRTHIQIADPPLDRTGSGDLESVAWYLAMAGLRSSSASHARCPVFHQLLDPDFERLSHVAVDLQSLFVRAGGVSHFCSANEQ
jgi:hypothetical protein